MEHLSSKTQFAILEAMLNGSQVAAVVTDPQREDNPIIYSNQTFQQLTGYSSEEIIGQNCRFLQGPDTNSETVDQLRNGIANKEKTTVTLQNYRKDGLPFWNRLNIEPIVIEEHLYFIGTQTDITNEIHQRLLLDEQEEEINQLLLPILPLHEGLGAVALVGKMDNRRFRILTNKLSEFVQQTSTVHVIIDVTGVIWRENFLYDNLLMIQHVLRLMGCMLYISGITPATAMDISRIKGQDQSLLTFSTVQQVLAYLNNPLTKVK
ncbi:PAS domain-containing protein [Planococcus shixiaomingii]|uniref:PAS domain-containing protein n=1 Tax=Planococcus shixiaomingii TaxID=3058393 RepID=UPI00260599C3|nr:PAS domain-containing protein [Planococcus sp. N022]WKA55977.1 PAS domain-containing protein [Planococcus sp. N022]